MLWLSQDKRKGAADVIEIIQRKEIENSATGNAPAENTATGNIVTEIRRVLP